MKRPIRWFAACPSASSGPWRPGGSGPPSRSGGCGERGRSYHADGTAEDDVLLLGQPVRAEGLADAGAIEADRAVPHDLLEGGGLLEAHLLQPLLPQTQPEKRVAAIAEGDEESADLARCPVVGSGHSPNRPKSTSATSPDGGSTTRAVIAAVPSPHWRRAKRCSEL